jgi:hypothetical protein
MNFDPTNDNELRASLDPRLNETEREELLETMRLLESERPTPLADFTDRLAAHLGLEREDRVQLTETAGRLKEERPLPRPSFRGELARLLSAPSAPSQGLRLRIAAYAGSGALLLAIVGIGLAGVGPLAS